MLSHAKCGHSAKSRPERPFKWLLEPQGPEADLLGRQADESLPSKSYKEPFWVSNHCVQTVFVRVHH